MGIMSSWLQMDHFACEALSNNSVNNFYYMGIMSNWLQMDPTIACEALSKNSEHNYLLYGHYGELVTNGSHNRR